MTLCDGIIASKKATFSTPFAALGLPPEGWKPTAEEALEAGLIQWVVPHEQLAGEAQRIAKEWVTSGATRSFRCGSTRDELKAVNASESVKLADAFFGAAFIKAQFRFLWSKKKWGPASSIDKKNRNLCQSEEVEDFC